MATKREMSEVVSIAHSYADEANVCWSSAMKFAWRYYKEERRKRAFIMKFGTKKQKEKYFNSITL